MFKCFQSFENQPSLRTYNHYTQLGTWFWTYVWCKLLCGWGCFGGKERI